MTSRLDYWAWLDQTLICLSQHRLGLDSGLHKEAEQIYLTHRGPLSDRSGLVRILAEYRALLLRSGFPLEEVARYDYPLG